MLVLTSLTHSLSFVCQGSSIDKASSLMVAKTWGNGEEKAPDRYCDWGRAGTEVIGICSGPVFN